MIRHGLETNRLFLKTYQYFFKSLPRPRWMLLEARIATVEMERKEEGWGGVEA